MRYCEPDSQKFKAPLPWIGMYVAAASLICFLAIVADAFSAFRNKKIWFPCKFFTINAATLTLLGVSMKMPLDVSSYMNGGSDQLAKLSSTVMMCIAIGILGACLTNLPSVITMKCLNSTIEKMEKSVQFAAQLLGETEEILKIFEQHELLCLHNVDQFASIDEWRAKMGQANPCDSPSSSDNNLVASSSGITDIEIHFLQIKFTAIRVYLDSEIVGHLEQWKGKTGKDLAENDDFFEALISDVNFKC